jgi:thioredoxin reductase (NADPH)
MNTIKKKIAIIGSGPAGLTAAIYTARADIDTTVYLGIQPGGQLTTTTEIENFPGFAEGIDGGELMGQMQKQAVRFGAKAELTSVERITAVPEGIQVMTPAGEQLFDAVIVASGATARYLGIPGEEEYTGRGYHSCATCDGFFYRGKNIIVVGGGDSAMEEATFLTRFADKVYLVHRRDAFRASPIMVERVKKNEKIEILYNTAITELHGKEKVTSVTLQNTVDQTTREMAIDGVFVAIGHNPNTTFVPKSIAKDDLGYLLPLSRLTALLSTLTLEQQHEALELATMSQIPGIFIAGDVTDRVYRQAITAAGDGCRAALDAQKWLENQK